MVKTVRVQIDDPEHLSRILLLVKTILGAIILIPHWFCLFFVAIAANVLTFLSWFAVLFTGKFPRSFFNFIVGAQDWGLRISAYLLMLRDEYPAFGLDSSYPAKFNVFYPEKLSRGVLILRLLFGWLYVGIPHGFCLFFRMIGFVFVSFVAWWAILFTGKIPRSMFSYISGTIRWNLNLTAYFLFLTDEYPPFTGKETNAY